MTCSIWFSEEPPRSWTTQNVRYSWLVDRLVERLDSEDEQLRSILRVSEEVHILDIEALRSESDARWRRAVDVISAVATDIVEGRLPSEPEEVQRTGLRAHYSQLLKLIHEHASTVERGPSSDPLNEASRQ